MEWINVGSVNIVTRHMVRLGRIVQQRKKLLDLFRIQLRVKRVMCNISGRDFGIEIFIRNSAVIDNLSSLRFIPRGKTIFDVASVNRVT